MKEEASQIFGVGSEEKGMDKAFEQACKLGRGVWRGMKKEWRGVDGRGKDKAVAGVIYQGWCRGGLEGRGHSCAFCGVARGCN